MAEQPAIVVELLKLANAAIGDRSWTRLRFAVTPDEHNEIERYFRAEGDGTFYARIKGVPLIVDVDAVDPPLRRVR